MLSQTLRRLCQIVPNFCPLTTGKSIYNLGFIYVRHCQMNAQTAQTAECFRSLFS